MAFDEPRIRVIIDTPTSPAARRPSHAGIRNGGLERGHLVNDGRWLGTSHRLANGDLVEPIDDHGLGAEAAQQIVGDLL